MNLDIDVTTGRVLIDGKGVWAPGEPVSPSESSVRYLDLSARLVIAEEEGHGVVAAVLFDEEEFPDTIVTSKIVKRFAKKTGVSPEMVARPLALARFPWGEIEFSVDPKQGDLSIVVRGR
ncbi:MAG: hypothetical protein EOP37_27550 [Rubrivivax sp.]|nr:MAG: hypothetical protein EOP37_27550 [Rubrivivax sp.]